MPSIVDMHAHYMPPALLDEAERNGAHYGVRLERNADGNARISFNGGPLLRPFFHQLCDLAHRLLQGTVVLPTAEHFPDPYDRSETALRCMFHRVATQMQVNPADVDVTLFASGDDLTRELVPFYSEKSSGAVPRRVAGG